MDHQEELTLLIKYHMNLAELRRREVEDIQAQCLKDVKALGKEQKEHLERARQYKEARSKQYPDKG